MHRNYQMIGVASGWGAQLRGCEDGPEILYHKLALLNSKMKLHYLWETLYPQFQEKHKKLSLDKALPSICNLNHHLADVVYDALKKSHFPIVIGGDHSIAVGTWNGVKEFKGKSPIGLIWIDAHMDSHSPSTTPSGAWHGMPLAALLGCGDPCFCQVKGKEPVLLPQNVCLVGIRSFESGEAELLKRLNVKVFFIEEVRRRGLSSVLEEAVRIVTDETSGFGISLDVDVMDPKEAPGVGSPELGGVKSKEVIESLSFLLKHENLLALEMVEYNPHKDVNDQTADICIEILLEILNEDV